MDETSRSGTVETLTIRDALNTKQESFVIGAESFSTTTATTVYIDISLRLQGTFGVF